MHYYHFFIGKRGDKIILRGINSQDSFEKTFLYDNKGLEKIAEYLLIKRALPKSSADFWDDNNSVQLPRKEKTKLYELTLKLNPLI